MEESKEAGVLKRNEKTGVPEESNEFTKARIIKNLVVVSTAFLISFTASDGLAILQSTMNKEVGVISFAVQYVCGFIASLLLPKCLIKKFGSKLVLVASMFAYVPYLSSNFYPVFGFMMPTSILVGFASSLVFNSLATYVNDLASLYTKLCFKDECQNHSLKSLPFEKNSLKNHLNDSPQFYNSLRKHKDSIFITKQSLFGESDAFSTDGGVTDKEIALIEFKCASPLNKRFPKDNSEKSNLIEEDFKKQQIPSALNDKIQTIFKQNFNLLKTRTEDHSTTENQSNNTIFDNNAGNLPQNCSATKHLGKRIFKSKIPSLSSVSEKNMASASDDGVESKIIHEKEQKDSSGITVPNSDKVIKVLETTTSRFFGFFGCVYQMSHIFSNVISYLIFNNNTVHREYTQNSSCVCGAEFCSMESACELHNLQVPSTETRYTLCTVYVVMSFASAMLTLLFLDNLTEGSDKVPFSLDMAIMTFKLHKNKNMLLLIPACLYIGMSQAFFIGDFTKDFIACAWGVEHISLVIIASGCAISFFAGVYALLEKHVGRYVFFFVSSAINLLLNVIMLYWTPDSAEPVMMFVVAAMFGGIFGILWCQVRAFIGLIFKEEEETAFGCYQLWHALGCAVVFTYSNYICTYIKIYLLLAVFTLAFIGYLLAERNYALRKKQCNKT